MSLAGGDATDTAVLGLPAAEAQMRDRLRASLFGTPCEPVRRGRYVVLGVLGRGGLGVVHAAYDPELDRKVALKVVDAHALGAVDLRARLRREAQALARLSHPNVVAVHDVGFDGDELYVAMALVEGCTLGAWLNEGERTWSEIRDVIVGVARGLEAAHRVGIVHRDVKPANVMVDREGRPHVLDFGLARAVGGVELAATGEIDAASSTTAAGVLLGTPPYMAPEQLDGGTIDARTDQWGLCVTAYECLFGVRPFVADSIAALRVRVRQPLDAPTRTVPRWLLRAIERGLRPDPAARHADMAALVRAFESDRHSRRRQWFAIGGALVLAAASAASAATVVAARPDPELLADIERLAHEAREAASARHFVHPAPDAPQQETALQAILALEGLDDDDARAQAQALRNELAAELAALGDAYWSLPDGRGYAADFYAASLMFVPEQPEVRARSLQTDGQLAVLRDKATRGEFSAPELESAQVLAKLAADDAAPEQALRRVQNSLEADDRISFLARPRSPTPASTAIASDPPSPTPPAAVAPTPPPIAAPTSSERRSRARTIAAEGWSALRRGDEKSASAAFHRALDADSREPAALRGLAEIHFDRGEYQRALDFATKAAAAAPNDARAHMQHGDAAFKVLRYAEARKAYRRAEQLGSADATRALARLDALQAD